MRVSLRAARRSALEAVPPRVEPAFAAGVIAAASAVLRFGLLLVAGMAILDTLLAITSGAAPRTVIEASRSWRWRSPASRAPGRPPACGGRAGAGGCGPAARR